MGRRPLRRGLFDGEGFPGNPPISRNRSTDSINVRARVGCFRGCGVAVGGLVKSPCLFRNMRPAHQTSAPPILLPAMWHNALDRGFRSAGIPGRRPLGSLYLLGSNPPGFRRPQSRDPSGRRASGNLPSVTRNGVETRTTSWARKSAWCRGEKDGWSAGVGTPQDPVRQAGRRARMVRAGFRPWEDLPVVLRAIPFDPA